MTKSTITREQLLEIIETDHVQCGEASYLARMALAAMASEHKRNPVLAYADSYRDMANQGVESVPIWSVITDLERNIAPLYRHAQPAPERDQVRREHAEWSQATFGDVGPVGPLKHLSKEALEAAAEPGDLSEWADIQFLLWDAQRRAGISDEQITQAMIEKLAVNKQREWPEPKDGEPRLHIKAQPAPVVNGEYGDAYQGAREDLAIWKRRALEAEESVRRLEQINDHLVKEAQGESRMGEPVIAQPAPVVPDGYVMVPKDLLSELRDWAHPEIEKYCEMWEGRRDSEFPALRKVISDAYALLVAAPQSPSSEPATVPGKWIPVSERIPDNTEPVLCIEKRADFGTYGQPFVCWHDGGGWVGKTNYRPIVTHWMPLPAAPQEVK